jgi:hypothetical protein
MSMFKPKARTVCGICEGRTSYGFCRECGARFEDGVWRSPDQVDTPEKLTQHQTHQSDEQLRLLQSIDASLATIKTILIGAVVLWIVGAFVVAAAINLDSGY